MALGKRLKSLIGSLTAAPTATSPWQPPGQPYPMLVGFDAAGAGLSGTAGLVAIWHLGVRPQWLKVAAVTNLALAIQSAANTAAIVSYKPNGGVYVAWAALQPAALLGPAQHVIATLKPVLQALPLASERAVPADIKPTDFPLPPETAAASL
ncbi:MAG: hypothetical protein EXR11_09745 [Rhodospirillaceae bacterium]|nr:hypothetical protein [Rhodospirillaceae bacterium]